MLKAAFCPTMHVHTYVNRHVHTIPQGEVEIFLELNAEGGLFPGSSSAGGGGGDDPWSELGCPIIAGLGDPQGGEQRAAAGGAGREMDEVEDEPEDEAFAVDFLSVQRGRGSVDAPSLDFMMMQGGRGSADAAAPDSFDNTGPLSSGKCCPSVCVPKIKASRVAPFC